MELHRPGTVLHYLHHRLNILDTSNKEIIKALENAGCSNYEIVGAMRYERYTIVTAPRTSDEVLKTFDILGKDFMQNHKITSIRLVRHLTSASLLDSKNAVERYLE